MKRLVVALLLASTLCMTGCGDTKKTEPAASTTEEVDKASSSMKDRWETTRFFQVILLRELWQSSEGDWNRYCV